MTFLWFLLHPRAALKRAAVIVDELDRRGDWRDIEAGIEWGAILLAAYLALLVMAR